MRNEIIHTYNNIFQLVTNNSITSINHLNYLIIKGEDKYLLTFKKRVNFIEELQNKKYNTVDLFNIIKFCFTGKNEINNNIWDNIDYVEAGFQYGNSDYAIRVFNEHIYKFFLIKKTFYNDTISDYVLYEANGIKEYQREISPVLKNFLNMPDHLTIAQFFRLIFLNKKESMFRLLSDNEYQSLTPLLVSYIIDTSLDQIKEDEYRTKLLNNIYDEKLIFINYSLQYREHKIERLQKQKELQIESIKKQKKNQIDKKITPILKRITNDIQQITKEKTMLKIKLSNINKKLQPNKQKNYENQLMLFEEQNDNSDNYKEQLLKTKENIKHKLSQLELQYIYLNRNYEDITTDKKEIISKYEKEIITLVDNIQKQILDERMNIEILIEKRKEITDKDERIIDKENIKTSIIKDLTKRINKFIYITKTSYKIIITDLYNIKITDENKRYIDINTISQNSKKIITLSFHLGLMDFVNYYKLNILPKILIFRITNNTTPSIEKLRMLLDYFRKPQYNQNTQLFVF